MAANPESICGECGKRYADHHNPKGRAFCDRPAHMRHFTDYPSDETLSCYIEDTRPELFRELVAEWQLKHGHTPEQPQ